MTSTLGVALLGCGRIARMFHLPVLAGLDSVHLVAVADADVDALAAAQALAPEAVGVRDVDGLAAVPGIDAVVVCLPTHLHAAAAVTSFEAGRHVYVEKPLALDVEEAGRIRDAWLASGRTGAVGFNFRFHPLMAAAREVLAAGALGDVVGIRSVFSSAPRDLPGWKRTRATGGGALLDLASHHIDLVRHLLATEVEAMSATITSRRTEADTAALSMRLATGPVAQVLATVSAAASDRVEILGTEATCVIDRMGSRQLSITPTAAPGGLGAAAYILRRTAATTYDRLRPPPEPSFAAALTAFVAHARSGIGSVAATIEDGHRCAAVVDAAERSAATAHEVALDPVGVP